MYHIDPPSRTTRAFSGPVHQYRSIHVNRTLTLTQEKTSLEQAIWPCQLGCLAQAQWSSSSSLRKVKQPPADQETATKVIIKTTNTTTTTLFPTILTSFFHARWGEYGSMAKHRKNYECCPVSQLIVRSQRLSWIQVLNCQNCSQCLKCHKSLGLLLGGFLKMSLSLSLYLYLSLSIFWSCHVFSSLWTNVSKVTSL